jgi:hypothetical protein
VWVGVGESASSSVILTHPHSFVCKKPPREMLARMDPTVINLSKTKNR